MPRRKPAAPPTQGNLAADFIESFCRVPKGEFAGKPMELMPFQRQLLTELFELAPGGGRRYRRAFWGMPRGSGKSGLASSLALFGLFDPLHVGAEVVVGAGDRAQARIIFDAARRMIEIDPVISERLRVYKNVIEEPKRGGTFRVLSADAPRAEGLSPSLAIVDEVHVQPNDDLWSVLALGTSKRRNSLILGITTAGKKTDSHGRDSLAYRLWQLGNQVASGERADLRDFHFRWYGADPKDDPKAETTWKKANPAYGILVPEEAFAADAAGGVPWDDFLTRRLNLWVSSNESWLPRGSFQACQSDRRIQPGEAIVVGFDGAFNGDCVALVGATLDGHLEPLAVWEKPVDDPAYQAPIEEVEAAIRDLCRTYDVKEIAADPFRWARSLQLLEGEGLPVVSFPQSTTRMTPATSGFRDEVVTKKLTWGGEPKLAAALARHVDAATIRTDREGRQKLAKESRASGRRIDLAVAGVMALNRARYYAAEQAKAPVKPKVRFFGFDD